MTERQCGNCAERIVPYEVYKLLGFDLVRRYRCPGCSQAFDLMTPGGRLLLSGIALGLPLVVAVLPDRKFEKTSERTRILWFLMAQLAVVAVLLWKERANSRRNPIADPAAPQARGGSRQR